MKLKFPISKVRLVLLGVGLGFIARFLFGGPENNSGNDRRFHEPIDAAEWEKINDAPDFPLEPPPQNH